MLTTFLTDFILQQVASLHSNLVCLSARVAQEIETMLTILTIGMLATPALSTVMVVRGYFDLFCVTSMPYLIVFWALCRAGQNLQNSSYHVTNSAMTAVSSAQSLGLLKERCISR